MTHTALEKTYYAATANPSPERPALQGDVHADVCVIGAGYTGLSTALFLAEAGVQVVVLEAVRVGFGASGRNGGQLVNSYSRDIDAVAQQVDAKAAKLIGDMAFEGNRIIRERIARYNIPCDLKNGGVFAAFNDKQMHHLEAQQKLWAKQGYDKVELLDKEQLRKIVHTDQYIGGSIDHGGGHMHSLNLAVGEAAAIESHGGKIYEHSAVVKIERGANPIVHTAQGRVLAKRVVVAGNAYLGNLVPELAAKAMPCGSQVVTTEILSDEMVQDLIPNGECVEDCNYLLDYYRITGDNRLLYGGGVVYGARDPSNVEALIRPKMLKTFPQLKNVKIEFAWTGNFLLTLSRLPQVGILNNNIYYSQGCSGHGITYTHLAGKVLSEAILGRPERLQAFAQLPHYPFPGGRMFSVPFSAIGAAWYTLRDRLGV